MRLSKYIGLLLIFIFPLEIAAQNIHYFFTKDVYQRSYFNPALNNKGKLSIASGLGVDFSTNGPSLSDFLIKKPEGGLLLSASNAINEMNAQNDIYGYSSVNTFDISLNTPFARVSIGHAWKANGWMQYSKDLAEFVTFGNGQFIGETLDLGPQIDYINYNELYLGLQKQYGSLSLGIKVKRLSGVESIKTENSKIELQTSDDVYQLTLDTDFELNSSRAFTYTDIDDFDLNVENFSFDNFLSNNGGWAFDLGASYEISDRLELSLSIVDIGSMTWDVDPKNYKSTDSQFFNGIDVSQYITSEEDFVITDSLEALLNLEETDAAFSTTLPSQIYLGGIYRFSDLWSFGAIIQRRGSQDRRDMVFGLNATARLYKFWSAGLLYSVKNGSAANIGLSTSLKIGPLVGFLSTDNILQIGTFNSTNSTIRAGLSLRL